MGLKQSRWVSNAHAHAHGPPPSPGHSRQLHPIFPFLPAFKKGPSSLSSLHQCHPPTYLPSSHLSPLQGKNYPHYVKPPTKPSTPPWLPSKHPGDTLYGSGSSEASQTHSQGLRGTERTGRAHRSHSKPAEQRLGCTHASTLAFPPGEAQFQEALRGSSQSPGAMSSFLLAAVAAIYSLDSGVSFLQGRAQEPAGSLRG